MVIGAHRDNGAIKVSPRIPPFGYQPLDGEVCLLAFLLCLPISYEGKDAYGYIESSRTHM